MPCSRSQLSSPVPVKLPGSVFSMQVSRPARDLGMQLPSGFPLLKERLVFLERLVLDDDRRHPPGAGVHDLQDLSQMPDRMRDRQDPGEVLVLHVDHQQRPFHQDLRTRDLISL